jgi:hypothetical protein
VRGEQGSDVLRLWIVNIDQDLHALAFWPERLRLTRGIGGGDFDRPLAR